VKPLAESVGSDILCECDVTNDDTMDSTFATLKEKWGKIDFLVHAIAFAGKDQLAGSFIDNTTREGFKSALDISSTRYMAADLGPRQIRVNAISAGPIKTLAAAGIGSGRHMFRFNKAASALQDNTDPMGVAGAALYLLSNLGLSCTGETHHVDGGFHAIGMPQEGPLRESMPD